MKRLFCLSILFLFQELLTGQNINLDFELSTSGSYTSASAITGWSLSSKTATTCGTNSWVPGSPEFSIMSTPSLVYPVLGILPNSPLGGTQIAVLNDLTPNQNVTRLSRSFNVVSNNCLLTVAFAGIWGDCGTTTCCSHSGFQFLISDLSGTVGCKSYTMTANSSCRTGGITYSTTVYNSQTVSYTNWQYMYIDLTSYIGGSVNIDVISSECTAGAHSGSLLFDIKEGGFIVCNGCSDPGLASVYSPSVSFCSGSSNAVINGPLGYSTYSWTAPPAYPISSSQSTLSSISLTNAVAGSIYTLATTNFWAQCVYYSTYTLVTGSLGATNLWSKPSCPQGASGSATVAGSGSGTGYTYVWTNSSNSVISTNSVVSNLAPGVYNVSLTAAGSASSTCGVAVNSITINATPPALQSLFQLYCGNPFTLCAPTGTNYQWYSGYTSISASSGGTSSCLAISTPTNGSTFRLGVSTPQGCRDSISYLLYATNPGTLTLNSTPLACQSIANGLATLSLTPAPGVTPGSLSFTMTSVGSTPSYSSTLGPGSSSSFSAGALSAGGQYSVSASDGVCSYSKTFAVNSYSYDYTLSPSGTASLCNGSSIAAGVVFSTTPSAGLYTFSWSPTNYILAGAQSQNALISASLSPGTQTTISYSVVVNPTIINCPLTKTWTLTLLNPASPSITNVPVLCQNANPYTISVTPPGGTFTGANGLSTTGLITPSLSSSTNTFMYTAPQIYTCAAATATAYYTIAPNPGLNFAITGNNFICAGQSSTLNMAGGLSYSWSTGANSSSIVVSPSVNTLYTGTASYTSTGCSSTFSEVVFVTPNPSLSITGPTLICLGDVGVLTASGAASYTWSNGMFGSSISINPSSGGTYTVWANNSYSCPAVSAMQQVIVAPKPLITVSGNTSVCQGQSVSLTANGADSFTWNSMYNGPVYTATPAASTTYTITGLNAVTNCLNSSTLAIQVINYPLLSFSGNTSICVGETTTLTGQGALNFFWGGGSTDSYIAVSPSLSTSYTLSGYNTSSCISSLIIPVNVSNCTGIETIDAVSSPFLFPNPSDGLFNLYIPETSDLLVYDALGRAVLIERKVSGSLELNLYSFNGGTYYLKVTNERECYVKKLIKKL